MCNRKNIIAREPQVRVAISTGEIRDTNDEPRDYPAEKLNTNLNVPLAETIAESALQN